MGGAEILVIILVVAILIFSVGLPLILRKYFPNKLWIGIILCLFLGTGQLYLLGGVKYLIGLGIFYVILKTLFKDATLASIVANLLSIGIIYWRFLKLNQKSLQKEKFGES